MENEKHHLSGSVGLEASRISPRLFPHGRNRAPIHRPERRGQVILTERDQRVLCAQEARLVQGAQFPAMKRSRWRRRIAARFQNIACSRGLSGAGQRHDGAFDQYEDRLFWQSIEGQRQSARDREPPPPPREVAERSSTSWSPGDPCKTPVLSRCSYGLKKAGLNWRAAWLLEPSILLLGRTMAGMKRRGKRGT